MINGWGPAVLGWAAAVAAGRVATAASKVPPRQHPALAFNWLGEQALLDQEED